MKKTIQEFDALTDCKRITFVIIPMAIVLIWLMPWFMEKNYRVMRWFGERIERIPGPTTTNE